MIRNDLMRCKVVPDVFFSERSLIEGEDGDLFFRAAAGAPEAAKAKDQVAATIKELRARG